MYLNESNISTGHQPECLWVDVGQQRIGAQLQLDHLRQVVEGPSLHHQQLLHVVETAGKHKGSGDHQGETFSLKVLQEPQEKNKLINNDNKKNNLAIAFCCLLLISVATSGTAA